jgi:palmitoyl-protein thioesterase
LQDPLQLDAYMRYNIFLPDINNERDDKNTNYADNLAALQRLVLFRFDEDTTGGQGCIFLHPCVLLRA